MTMKSLDVDHLLDNLGKPGKLQLLSCFFLSANYWIAMANHMSSVFFAAKTGYSCNVGNISSHVLPLVTNNASVEIGQCFVLFQNSSEERKCSAWTYHLPAGETTIISEFDLVCDDSYKSDLATTIYFAGVMIGGIVFGDLADRYGRKRVVLFALLLSGTVGVATFIFRIFTVYIILRFILGILIQFLTTDIFTSGLLACCQKAWSKMAEIMSVFTYEGVQNSSFILAMELLSTRYRALGGLVFITSGSFGVLLLNFLAYVIKDWKYIQLSTGLLPFLLILPVWWFVPESLRWQLVQKNFTQAELIVKQIAAFNKLPIPEKVLDKKTENELEEKPSQENNKGNILDVFKSPKLRSITLKLGLLWFTISSGYYGLAFHISFLFGNKYLNFAISTMLDTAIVSTLFWIVPRYGRRRPLAIAYFVSTVAFGVCAIITSQPVSSSLKVLSTAMAILGKSALACCICIAYTFTSELYPTTVRNVGLGLNTFWTRVGGMAAPQIFFLGELTSAFVPYTFLTAVSLASGFLTLLLPETRDKTLSDRLEISKPSLVYQNETMISQSDRSQIKTDCYETTV